MKDFFSKCNPIRRKLRIWSHLLKKSLIENFIFCAVTTQKMKFPVKNFVKNVNKFADFCRFIHIY